jgi:hypothetical protein
MNTILIRFAAILPLILPTVGCTSPTPAPVAITDASQSPISDRYTTEKCIARGISQNYGAIEAKNWCAGHQNGAK